MSGRHRKAQHRCPKPRVMCGEGVGREGRACGREGTRASCRRRRRPRGRAGVRSQNSRVTLVKDPDECRVGRRRRSQARDEMRRRVFVFRSTHNVERCSIATRLLCFKAVLCTHTCRAVVPTSSAAVVAHGVCAGTSSCNKYLCWYKHLQQ